MHSADRAGTTGNRAGVDGLRPYPLEVDEAILDDLFDRVRRTRWPDAVVGAGWSHGTELAYARELAAYWVDGFDWRAQEARLNRILPGSAVTIGGHRVHFALLHGRGPDPLPLVVLHGWPGSFAEMVKIAPLLADPLGHGADATDAFEVIVPSLPGHGLSEPVLEAGFGADQCAEDIHVLMTEV